MRGQNRAEHMPLKRNNHRPHTVAPLEPSLSLRRLAIPTLAVARLAVARLAVAPLAVPTLALASLALPWSGISSALVSTW